MTKNKEPQTIEEKLDRVIMQQATILEQQEEIISKLDEYGIDIGRKISYSDYYEDED